MRSQTLTPNYGRSSSAASAHLSLVGLSDHTGPLQISRRLSFGLLLFGFALEGQGLLQLLGDVEAVEVPFGSDHRLEGKETDIHTVRI